MIIVTKPTISESELDHIRERIEQLGLRTHISRGEHRIIIGCSGDESLLRDVPLLSCAGVESAPPVLKPYKLASREFAASPTVVKVGDAVETHIGGRSLAIIAGPCSVEGIDMLRETAVSVRAAGARLLRGGAYKPRRSPYAFHGLGEAALGRLAGVRAETGLPVVTQGMDRQQAVLRAWPRVA